MQKTTATRTAPEDLNQPSCNRVPIDAYSIRWLFDEGHQHESDAICDDEILVFGRRRRSAFAIKSSDLLLTGSISGCKLSHTLGLEVATTGSTGQKFCFSLSLWLRTDTKRVLHHGVEPASECSLNWLERRVLMGLRSCSALFGTLKHFDAHVLAWGTTRNGTNLCEILRDSSFVFTFMDVLRKR